MRYLTIGALLLALSAGAYGRWQAGRADGALAALGEAQARVAGLEEAGRAVNRYLLAVQADRDRWAAVAAETDQLEGRDETVNPYLGAVLDRVRNP